MLSSFQNHRRRSIVIGLGLLLLGLIALIAAVLAIRSTYPGVPVRAGRPAQPSVDSIAGWMTVRYIARTYGVPEPVLLEALGIDARQARRRTLAGVARTHDTTTEADVDRVREAILSYRGGSGATPTPPANRAQ